MENPPPLAPVDPRALTLPKERNYFAVALLFSIFAWLILAITIIGLFYAVVIGPFVWLGNGLMVAALRSEAVRVSERQMPDLDATFHEVCARLGVRQPPELYVIQAGGALNAFATKHAGRNFVVVYSDMLEAFGPSSAEIRFILGHEIGHICSNHILKNLALLPALLMPLLGPAYSRACESSCDRHGAAASGDIGGSLRAMLTLAGGKETGRKLDPAAFADQYPQERGFFVSWHELTSGYPTLSKRTSDLRALHDPLLAVAPARNPFAYLFAMITPGGRLGGGANAIVFIFVIGLLAAMAIPAFQKVRQMSELKMCLNNLRQLSAAATQYAFEKGHVPRDMADLVGDGKYVTTKHVCPKGGIYRLQWDATIRATNVVCSRHGTVGDITAQFQRAQPR